LVISRQKRGIRVCQCRSCKWIDRWQTKQRSCLITHIVHHIILIISVRLVILVLIIIAGFVVIQDITFKRSLKVSIVYMEIWQT